jgi:hypothetical protein
LAAVGDEGDGCPPQAPTMTARGRMNAQNRVLMPYLHVEKGDPFQATPSGDLGGGSIRFLVPAQWRADLSVADGQAD